MKIVNKTYLLIAVLIGAAIINLALLYSQQEDSDIESYSIIKAGDIKVDAEAIAGLSTLIASGNENERKTLQDKINLIQSSIDLLGTGGEIDKITVHKVPQSVLTEFQNVITAWNEYKQEVLKVEKTPVFDPEALLSQEYDLVKAE